MNGLMLQIAGWVPAVILPLAAVIQLIKILKEKNVQGVSTISWFLFGVANIGLYIFTEKYFSLQALLGLLGTALVDFVIVVLVLYRRKRP